MPQFRNTRGSVVQSLKCVEVPGRCQADHQRLWVKRRSFLFSLFKQLEELLQFVLQLILGNIGRIVGVIVEDQCGNTSFFLQGVLQHSDTSVGLPAADASETDRAFSSVVYGISDCVSKDTFLRRSMHWTTDRAVEALPGQTLQGLSWVNVLSIPVGEIRLGDTNCPVFTLH